ncbi:MAG: HAD family phosphatase [Chloroflexota bacterium]
MDRTLSLTLPGPFTGVLLDLDGTLVDTEKLWLLAKQRMFARYGTAFEHADHLAVFGRDDQYTGAYLTRRFGLPEERTEAIRVEYLALVGEVFSEGVDLRPGTLELLRTIKGVVPVGLASNTKRELVDIVLDRAGLLPWLDTVTTSDGRRPKPAPDIYLAACVSLGVTPEEAVAIEDSPTGIAAARAAGLTCIAVPSESHEGLDAADHIVGSLLDLVAG